MLYAFRTFELTGRLPPVEMNAHSISPHRLRYKLEETSLLEINQVFQPHILEKLCINDIISLIAKWPSFASKITNPDILSRLDNDHLIWLGKGSEDFATRYFNNTDTRLNIPPNLIHVTKHHLVLAKKLFARLVRESNSLDLNIILLAEEHFEIASEIFDNKSLFACFSISDQARIVAKHPILAMKVVKSFDLREVQEELSEMSIENQCEILVRLGLNNPDVTEYILTTPALRRILRGDDYAALGSDNLSNATHIATHLFPSPSLCSVLDGTNLLNLSLDYPEIIKIIINTPHLLDKLSPSLLAQMCAPHLDISTHVFSTSQLAKKLLDTNESSDWTHIGKKHVDIAMLIIRFRPIRPLLNALSIKTLSRQHVEVARVVFNTPSLLAKLSPGCILSIASAHSEIAKRCLKTKEFTDLLTGLDLERLSSTHFSVASFILHSPTLSIKLFSAHLASIGTMHPLCANIILQTPELYKKLNISDLMTFTVSRVDSTKLVGNTPELFEKIVSISAARSQYSVDVCRELVEGPLNAKISPETKAILEKDIELAELLFNDLFAAPAPAPLKTNLKNKR